MPTCLHPKSVHGVLYPCGKCPVCRQNIRQAKGDRFLLASAFNRVNGGSNFFVTLTYDDENLNYAREPNRHDGDWYPCFNKDDFLSMVKLWRKRWERAKSGQEVKYFISSEYGTHTFRPHYHAILLFKKRINQLDVDNLLSDTWKYGFHQLSALNDSRVQYCAKYCLKDDYHYLKLRSSPVVSHSLVKSTAFHACEKIDRSTGECFIVYKPKYDTSTKTIDSDYRKPFQLISNKFLSDDAITFLANYIINGGNVREFFEINGKRVNFDTYIKTHLPQEVLDVLHSMYEDRKSEIQDTLSKSRATNSKLIDNGLGSQVLSPDYTKDMKIYKHRIRLQQLKKSIKSL